MMDTILVLTLSKMFSADIKYSHVCRLIYRFADVLCCSYTEPSETLSGAERLLDELPGHRLGTTCL